MEEEEVEEYTYTIREMFHRLSTLKINSLSNVFLRMTLAQKKTVGKMHIPEKFFINNILIDYGYNKPEIATIFN